MPRKFAQDTEVPADRSRAEIERLLDRYGATGFYYGRQGDAVLLGFQAQKRNVLFRLSMPSPGDRAFTEYVSRGRAWLRTEAQARKLYEQAVRQKWRALALVIKAKLEAIESRISSFDDEFLAFIVLPTGRTVGQEIAPQIAPARLAAGEEPKLLPFHAG